MTSPRRSSAFIASLYTTLGICLLVIAFCATRENYRFDHKAIASTGTVVRLTTTTGGRGPHHFVHYRYADQVGKRYDASYAVWYPDWQILPSMHGTVPVLYLADDPGQSRINLPYARGNERTKVYVLSIIGLASTCIGGLFFALLIRAMRASSWTFFARTSSSGPKRFHKVYKS